MYKAWLLLFPILCCMLSCDALSTGGNPSEEGRCSVILKDHGGMWNSIEMKCRKDSVCEVKFYFVEAYFTKENGCNDGFEYKLVLNGESKTVKVNYDRSKPSENKTMDLVPDLDGHVHFSLFDKNDVEKKYDIDLSGIINSYTVRGDSIDVHVMENCNLQLLFCSKEIVYGSKLRNGEYTFSANEGCGDHYIYKCIWHNQGSLETDDLDIYASIYWKK